MTDLTPEQIEQWAGDENAEMGFLDHLEGALQALSDPAVVTLPWDASILHAHALHLQQQATIERLTNLIEEHNAKQESQCIELHGHTGSLCAAHERFGEICNKCPRRKMIDLTDGVK